jgi:hypothetical protein
LQKQQQQQQLLQQQQQQLLQQQKTPMVLRLAIYPPKLQTVLLEALHDVEEDGTISLSAKNPTHTLSVIQLHVYNEYQLYDNGLSSVGTGGLYVVGRLEETNNATNCLPLAMQQQQHQPHMTSWSELISSTTSHDSSVSRAYWKLQEAWERYTYGTPKQTSGMTALDCGAAPGGWTKFLMQRYHGHLDRIYAIDPGQLAPEVWEVNDRAGGILSHVRTTIQKAMTERLVPELRHQEQQVQHKTIDIWVSDMCVKDMPAQIDWFLEARKLGIVAKGTFFVLTLKCFKGHSSATFDKLVEEQVGRLTGEEENLCCCCCKVQVLHLFSNRSSERTIVGYCN